MDGHDTRRPGGPRRVRRLGLLAVLLALIVPTATATTTTPVPATAITVDVGATALTRAAQGDLDTSVNPAGGVHRDGSDTGVLVVRKVRGVFLPHGLVPPTFEPADVARPQRTPSTYNPTWHATVPTDVHPRRGPPGVSVFSSP